MFGGLTLWVLTESSLKWYIKTACISFFCVFTVIFWSSIHSFLGWPADENDMPEKILIHWVIIKEPNKFTEFNGRIYVLLESAEEIKMNPLLKFFGYEKKERIEPRLHGLSYSRELHEQIEKEIMGRLRKGQPVMGTLKRRNQKREDPVKKDREKTATVANLKNKNGTFINCSLQKYTEKNNKVKRCGKQ